MKLSIIIPVCNVEQYIGDCLESIYRQGLDDGDFEVIVVNDGSTDHSIKVVEGVRMGHHNIIIMNQNNAGPSVARNAGMERARGDYVLFVDSDDLLMDGGLSVVLKKALETDADMVVADFMRLNDEEIVSGQDARMVDTGVVDKTGLDYYVEDYDPGAGSFIWRILYKRALLDSYHIRLEPGVYYEDIPFLQECYLRAGRVIGLHLLYYIYRIRRRSCTYSFTMKNAMDYNTAIARSWGLTGIGDLPEVVERRLKGNVYLLFNYAIDCIISVFSSPSERKEIIDDLVRKVPDLHFEGGLRARVVSSLFRAMPYKYVQWRVFRRRLGF